MVIMRKIKDGEMVQLDEAITNERVGPAVSEQMFEKTWTDFVNGYDDGSGLMTFDQKEAEILG
jgi:hypothetical protein